MTPHSSPLSTPQTSDLPDRVIIAGMKLNDPIGEALAGGREIVDRIETRSWSWPIGHGAERRAAVATALAATGRPPKSALGWALKRLHYAGHYASVRRRFEADGRALVLCWNGLKPRTGIFAAVARDLGYPVLYLEITPFPQTVAVDFQGVNARNSLPRRGDFYLDWRRDGGISGLWRQARENLRARVVSGSRIEQRQGALDTAAGEKFIFVPLQVPGDTQVRVFGDWVGGMAEMIEMLARLSTRLPEGWHLRLKEHPSSHTSFTARLKALETTKFRLDNTSDTFEQVAAAQAVLTLNSSVGLQAFFYDKPVIALGEAFWAFEGNARHATSEAQLAEALSDPDTITFDAAQREAFLDFCLAEYFPREESILAGNYGIAQVLARDARIAARLDRLDRG